MKKLVTWLSLVVLFAATILTASCNSASTTTTPAGPVVLTVTNASKTKAYSMADLQALKSFTGNGGTKNKKGVVTGPISYKGVALVDLLNAVGGIASGQMVKFTGTDGYMTTITYDQITSGGFNMYDTAGNPATPKTKPVLVVVYSANGADLDSATGPLEVGLLSTENLISDGSLWAKLLKQIDIVAVP